MEWTKGEKYKKLRIRAQDPSSPATEREIAKNAYLAMEQKYPGIEAEAQRAESAEKEGTLPSWRDAFRDFVQQTLSDVTDGLTQAHRIDQEVAVKSAYRGDELILRVSIPFGAVERAESEDSLEEYARLVGLRVGRGLSVFLDETLL